MLPSAKPYGPRITADSIIKLKGATILQPIGQWPYWSQFWTTWDWVTISRTIDNLETLGINCLQVTATGLIENGVPYPSDTVMRSNITQLAGYAASKGMVLNPQLGYQPAHTFAGGAAAATIAAVRMAKLFCEQSNVAFIDIMNEVNLSPAAGWSGPNAQALSDIATMDAGVRAVVGNILCTWSIGCSNVGDYSGSWSQAVAPYTDFHNVHAYTYQASGTAPLVSDLNAMRGAGWYKGRFVIGEIGVPVFRGEALQTSWMAGAKLLIDLPDCLGAIVWGATDTSGYYDVTGFGLMDSTGTTIRPALTAPVSTWPGVL